MTKKHFEAIATEIKNTVAAANGDKAVISGIAMTTAALANVFANDNPRFDRVRFAAACGLNN